MKKIYVGNIAHQSTKEALEAHFAQFGPLHSCVILMDKMTGESRGFGFIEIEDDARADAAIQALDGQPLDGRNLKVNEAREKTEGSGGRGGFRSGGGGGRSFGGGGGGRSFGGGGGGGNRYGGGGDRRGGGDRDGNRGGGNRGNRY